MGRPRKPILPGATFNKLTFLKDTRIHNKERYGLFKCACGKKTEARIRTVALGMWKSCGCYLVESNQARRKHPEKVKKIVTDELMREWFPF